MAKERPKGTTIRSTGFTIFEKVEAKLARMVDPVPQALVLTAIVIGVAVLALALSLAIRLYHHYGTLNLRKIREQRW
ncbi:hypothetical protein ES703_74803 [subsurface metagenome]